MTKQKNALAQLFAACWKDEALKARFMADPASVLAEYDMPVPEGMDVKVVENADDCVHITLPAPPAGVGELTDPGDAIHHLRSVLPLRVECGDPGPGSQTRQETDTISFQTIPLDHTQIRVQSNQHVPFIGQCIQLTVGATHGERGHLDQSAPEFDRLLCN